MADVQVHSSGFAPSSPSQLFEKSSRSFAGQWTRIANPGGSFRMPNMQPVANVPYVYMQDYASLRRPSLGFKLTPEERSALPSSVDIEEYCSQKEAKRSVTPCIRANQHGKMTKVARVGPIIRQKIDQGVARTSRVEEELTYATSAIDPNDQDQLREGLSLLGESTRKQTSQHAEYESQARDLLESLLSDPMGSVKVGRFSTASGQGHSTAQEATRNKDYYNAAATDWADGKPRTTNPSFRKGYRAGQRDLESQLSKHAPTEPQFNNSVTARVKRHLLGKCCYNDYDVYNLNQMFGLPKEIQSTDNANFTPQQSVENKSVMNWGSQASAPNSRMQTVGILKYETGTRLYSQASAVPPGRRMRSNLPVADGLGPAPYSGYETLRNTQKQHTTGLSPLDGMLDQSVGKNGKENKQNLKRDIKTFISKLNRKKFENGQASIKTRAIENEKVEVSLGNQQLTKDEKGAPISALEAASLGIPAGLSGVSMQLQATSPGVDPRGKRPYPRPSPLVSHLVAQARGITISPNMQSRQSSFHAASPTYLESLRDPSPSPAGHPRHGFEQGPNSPLLLVSAQAFDIVGSGCQADSTTYATPRSLWEQVQQEQGTSNQLTQQTSVAPNTPNLYSSSPSATATVIALPAGTYAAIAPQPAASPFARPGLPEFAPTAAGNPFSERNLVLNEEQLEAAAVTTTHIKTNLEGRDYSDDLMGAIGHSTERHPWRGDRTDPTDISGAFGSATSAQSSLQRLTAPALGNMQIAPAPVCGQAAQDQIPFNPDLPGGHDGTPGAPFAERSMDERHSSAGEEHNGTVDTVHNDNTTTRVFSGDSARLSKKYEVAIGTTSMPPASPVVRERNARAPRIVAQGPARQGQPKQARPRPRAASTLAKAELLFQPIQPRAPGHGPSHHRHNHSTLKDRTFNNKTFTKDSFQGDYLTISDQQRVAQLARPTFSFRERFMIGRRRVSKMQSPCKYMDAMNHYLYDDTSPRHDALAASHHTGATLIADQIVRKVIKNVKSDEKKKQQLPDIPNHQSSGSAAITPLNTGKSITEVFNDIFGQPGETRSNYKKT